MSNCCKEYDEKEGWICGLEAKEDNAVWEVISAQRNHILCPPGIYALKIEETFLREVLDKFLNYSFVKVSIFLANTKRLRTTFYTFASVMPLNRRLRMFVPNGEQQNFLESYPARWKELLRFVKKSTWQIYSLLEKWNKFLNDQSASTDISGSSWTQM